MHKIKCKLGTRETHSNPWCGEYQSPATALLASFYGGKTHDASYILSWSTINHLNFKRHKCIFVQYSFTLLNEWVSYSLLIYVPNWMRVVIRYNWFCCECMLSWFFSLCIFSFYDEFMLLPLLIRFELLSFKVSWHVPDHMKL